MKRKYLITASIITFALCLSACDSSIKTNGENKADSAANILTEVKTTQFYTDEKLPDGDVEKILSAGVNAPSAMNTQPWHFTAVTDEAVMQKTDEDIDKIWTRFYRVDDVRNDEYGSNGLGLAMVKSIVELHGGTITVKSIPGMGTKFRIAL